MNYIILKDLKLNSFGSETTPVLERRAPRSDTRKDPRSDAKDPRSDTRDPRSATRDPPSDKRDPRSDKRDLPSDTETPNSRKLIFSPGFNFIPDIKNSSDIVTSFNGAAFSYSIKFFSFPGILSILKLTLSPSTLFFWTIMESLLKGFYGIFQYRPPQSVIIQITL